MLYKRSYHFFFNIQGGDQLPKNHLQKVSGGVLYIEKVQKVHDTGEYVCKAQNSNGQGMTRSVFVNVLGKNYF